MRRRERELEAEVAYLRGLVTSLLERIDTSPRLVLHPGKSAAPALADDKPYISDLPYDDERWNAQVSPAEAFAEANETLDTPEDEQ